MSDSSKVIDATCRFVGSQGRGDVLCHCAGVAEVEVDQAVRGLGAESVGEVMEATGAGTGCRACHCRIERVLAGLPATCSGRFDWCAACGCVGAVCACNSSAGVPATLAS